MEETVPKNIVVACSDVSAVVSCSFSMERRLLCSLFGLLVGWMVGWLFDAILPNVALCNCMARCKG